MLLFHRLQLLKWPFGHAYMPNGIQGKNFDIFKCVFHRNLNFRIENLLRTPENLDNQIARQLKTQMDNTRL